MVLLVDELMIEYHCNNLIYWSTASGDELVNGRALFVSGLENWLVLNDKVK